MQTDNMLNVFTLFTDIDLKQEEVPLFRGAMIRVAGSDNVDFHLSKVRDSDICILVFSIR